MKFIFLLMIPLTCMACTKKDKPSNPVKKEIFIHGDPMEFVKGATLSQKVDLDFFNRSPQLYLYTGLSFVSKSEVTHTSAERNHIEENRPSEYDESESNSAEDLVFKVSMGDHAIVLRSQTGYTKMTLDSQNKAISFDTFEADGRPSDEEVRYKVLHLSTDSSGELFSMLLHARSPDNEALVALYYTNNPDRNMGEKTNLPYYYAQGKGLKTPHPDPNIELSICGDAQKVQSHVEMATQQWNLALNNLGSIHLKTRDQFPPFTEFEHNCVFTVDAYLTEHDPYYANYGFAAVIPHINRGYIVDSDMFLMEKEFQKTGLSMMDSRLSESLNWTILHELGHILGLDHQMDGPRSIMSYEDETRLREYDYMAIQALYSDTPMDRPNTAP